MTGLPQPRSGASISAQTIALEAGDREARAGKVEPRRGHVARVRHQGDGADQRQRHDGHVDQEHAAPVEVLDQEAAGDRADRDADAGHRRPGGDRLRALLGREDVGQDRERRRHDPCSAETHDRARGDQRRRVRSERRDDGPEPEHGQPGQERALAPEAVAEAAGGEQQTGEDQQVAVHDPLQLARTGVELLADRGQPHVEDGVAHRDQEQREREYAERLPAAGIRWSRGGMRRD